MIFAVMASGRKVTAMVLIDMRKPESCVDCPFLTVDEDCRLRPELRVESFREQYKNCPLKEVQE